ncbi:3-phosphoserine/phosphohydroxythreonine transaminase [bacterium]|nr:3-phosphoserine/phosphohydroxythreonine transaminase [bacterium]
MTKRLFNFSAGPATLPLDVLKKAQAEFLSFNDLGMSIMEMSHRSKPFEAVLERAKTGVKDLLNVPDTHEVLFLQGGASLQFSMVAQNLSQEGKSAAVINTGSWTQKAIKEIKKETEVNIIASSEKENFLCLPNVDSTLLKDASFAYMCSNNTIFGTQFKEFPNSGDVPLVADMSSDILSRPLDISKFGLIFAGAQKNIGPSGVTLVIMNKSLLERSPNTLPSMLNYNSFVSSNSLYNTIPTFGIYMIALVMEWLKDQGGLSVMADKNEKKAAYLYDAIDNNDYYYCPINQADRSLMNVVFRLHDSEEKEALFVQEAKEKGLDGLKGHRSVGGLRASIYNAHPYEGVEELVRFMKEFQLTHQKKATVSA